MSAIAEQPVSTLHFLDKTGDTKIEWDPKDEKSVNVAREAFARAISEGGRAFLVKRNKRDDKSPVTEFAADLGQVVLTFDEVVSATTTAKTATKTVVTPRGSGGYPQHRAAI